MDRTAATRLATFEAAAPALQANLPVDPKYKPDRPGTMTPLVVADDIARTGQSRAIMEAVAFSLPNDPKVWEAKGAKQVMMSNYLAGRRSTVLLPLAQAILDPAAFGAMDPDTYFTWILMHEVSHTLGPRTVTKDGTDVTVGEALGEYYSPIEEAFEIVNQSSITRRLEIEFDFPGKNIAPDWEGTYPLPAIRDKDFFAPGPGHIVSLDGEPEGSWSTLFWHVEHGRNVIWVRDYVSGIPRTSLEMVCLSNLEKKVVNLAPGDTTRFPVVLAFGLNRGKATRLYAKCQEKLARGWTPARETKRIRKLLNSAPPLPEKRAASGIVRACIGQFLLFRFGVSSRRSTAESSCYR